MNDGHNAMPCQERKKGLSLKYFQFGLRDLKVSWKVEKMAHSKHLLITIFSFHQFKASAKLGGRHQEECSSPWLPMPEPPELCVVLTHCSHCQRRKQKEGNAAHGDYRRGEKMGPFSCWRHPTGCEFGLQAETEVFF